VTERDDRFRPWLRLALAAVLAWLAWRLRTVLVPLALAWLLTLVLEPLRRRLAARLGPSLAAAACTAVLVLAPLVLVLPLFADLSGFLTWAQTLEPAELLPRLREWQEALLARLPPELSERLAASSLTEQQWQLLAARATGVVLAVVHAVVGFFGGFFGLASLLLLLPVFAFYLFAGAPWLPRIRAALPPARRPGFDRVAPRIEEVLRVYLGARLLVALLKGLLAFAALLALGFPGADTLGLLVGVGSLIPVLGPFLAFLAMAAVAMVDGGHTGGGLVGLAAAGVLYAVLETVEGYLLLPRLVGRSLGLSDFAVLLAVLAGGALLGFLGFLVAIPAVAVGRVLWVELVRPRLAAAGAVDAVETPGGSSSSAPAPPPAGPDAS